MMKSSMRLHLVCLSLVLMTLLGACSTTSRIDTTVTRCCSTNEYTTFAVKSENIPAFLGPLMLSNFSVAFANKGMQPVTASLH